MHITAKLSTGRAKCRWYHKGKWCKYNIHNTIPKGQPTLVVDGDSAGGGSTLTLCKTHAPKFIKEFHTAEAEFNRLMEK